MIDLGAGWWAPKKRQKIKNKIAHNIFQPGLMWESKYWYQNWSLWEASRGIGWTFNYSAEYWFEYWLWQGLHFIQVLCLKIFPWLTPALEVKGAHVTKAISSQIELSELGLCYWGHSLRDTVKEGTARSRQLVLVPGHAPNQRPGICYK